jgi:small multidrug resistance family-3 protein
MDYGWQGSKRENRVLELYFLALLARAENVGVLKRSKYMTEVARSLSLFVLAGLCEIGGGYLVWLWLREGKGMLMGVLGAGVLILYGVVPTFQPAHFGRVYAAYGGIFVILSLCWGWLMAREVPDAFDVLGGAMCLIGVFVIMYWPRA